MHRVESHIGPVIHPEWDVELPPPSYQDITRDSFPTVTPLGSPYDREEEEREEEMEEEGEEPAEGLAITGRGGMDNPGFGLL